MMMTMIMMTMMMVTRRRRTTTTAIISSIVTPRRRRKTATTMTMHSDPPNSLQVIQAAATPMPQTSVTAICYQPCFMAELEFKLQLAVSMVKTSPVTTTSHHIPSLSIGTGSASRP